MTDQASIDAGSVMRTLVEAGFGPFFGVPCSFLAPLVTWCEQNAPEAYVAANNEGEAVAMAAGSYLAGRRPVVLIQNSGLGNAVNPFTSLCHPMRIPLLLLVTWRGEPGRPDEPQHRLMGSITLPLLDLMEIDHQQISTETTAFREQVRRLSEDMWGSGLSRALVVPGGSIRPESAALPTSGLPPRRDVIAAVVRELPDDVVVVATTGKTARELEANHDRPANLYVVGSMGCASSIALGIAGERHDRAVVVLDGDGAALMRLEAMVSIGAHRPERFAHVLLDNGAYESTGGQRSNSSGVDFLAIAEACGYATARTTDDAAIAAGHTRDAVAGGGPHLIRVGIGIGSDPALGRPSKSPAAVAERLRGSLAARSMAVHAVDR
ncbi:phosphonopyruvate decarboxylase [Saccharothrix luteola]|uniref:phosphonopyruvate decarboxylase n=1 Tax=Saccharothrix luteola TaxID=2893018 RepID=UPI001E46E1C4|nr:phosphonopyruvate decarboxylase [Saccharothrix luteola]MCC8251541.1 phosphonopyruvate decarboxylase [Saccharothrix luteola]